MTPPLSERLARAESEIRSLREALRERPIDPERLRTDETLLRIIASDLGAIAQGDATPAREARLRQTRAAVEEMIHALARLRIYARILTQTEMESHIAEIEREADVALSTMEGMTC